MKRFLALEEKRVCLDTQRTNKVVTNYLSNLDDKALLWSSWDDTYQFVQGNNPNYIKINLTYETVYNLLDFVIYCNRDNKVVLNFQTSHCSKSLEEIPKDKLQRILKFKQLLQHQNTKSSLRGFIDLDTPTMVISRPITQNDQKEPIGGTLIWGYYLTPERCKKLIDQSLQLQVNVKTTKCEHPCCTTDEHTLHTCLRYLDINDNYLFSLSITHKREIYLQGLEAFKLFTLILFLMGFIVTLLFLFFLERSILARFEKATQQIKNIAESKEYQPLRIEGQDEFAALTSSINKMLESLQEKQGAVEEALSVATQEICKRQLTEIRLQKAKQYAEEVNASKDVFLANVSHEIRTPMNGIVGLAALLEQENLTVQQKQWTKTIRESSNILLHIMNDILDFSKIESGKLELEKEDFDLRECLEDVVNLFSAKVNESNFDLICEVDCCTPQYVVGDAKRIRQILINLVSNAIKFTNEGHIAIRVTHRVESESIILDVIVEDSGIGIPQDRVGSVFEAFSQVDNSTSRIYGGTGLGLNICKKLVEMMEGTIFCESHVNRGTKFSFAIKVQKSSKVNDLKYLEKDIDYLVGKHMGISTPSSMVFSFLNKQCQLWGVKASRLEGNAVHNYDVIFCDNKIMEGALPRTPVLLATTQSTSDISPEITVLHKPIKASSLFHALMDVFSLTEKESVYTSNQVALGKFSIEYPLDIMLVEDDRINQKVAGFLFKELGYNIDIACNGLEAVNILKEKKYDIVFMDMQMPVMNGLEATKIITATQSENPIIIAMTANARQKDREECFSVGMNDYISKPITMAKLQCLLKKWGEALLKQKTS
ncbi:ATP-binding protein [Candidatus Uabimicrobium amorphum]|uniref:histidine kinase n=1 Tax=Uabimicrobium amorphum TaxID=2596890 RepID=A0A5S9IQR6_UABAM|nr:ATP-binding protein [Candidatus Uabimicrobium amorphum]BBM84955.1 two-component hybrid sensor and regulator [Candidatus Uabimicrobium amorphum]